MCQSWFKNVRSLQTHKGTETHKKKESERAQLPAALLSLLASSAARNGFAYGAPSAAPSEGVAYSAPSAAPSEWPVDDGGFGDGGWDGGFDGVGGSVDGGVGYGDALVGGDAHAFDGDADDDVNDKLPGAEAAGQPVKRRRTAQPSPSVLLTDAVGMLRPVLQTAVFHTMFWQDLGRNSTAKQDTRNNRANAGLRLLTTYLTWLADSGATLSAVQCDEALVDWTSNGFGLAFAAALHRSAESALHKGSPTLWLQLARDDDASVQAFLTAHSLTKSQALTALAMLRAVMRWLKKCATEAGSFGGVVPGGLHAYLTGFETAALAPQKRISSFKRSTVRKATAKNAELWSTRAEEYARLLYGSYGELMFHLKCDLDRLVQERQRLDPATIVRTAWSLIARLT